MGELDELAAAAASSKRRPAARAGKKPMASSGGAAKKELGCLGVIGAVIVIGFIGSLMRSGKDASSEPSPAQEQRQTAPRALASGRAKDSPPQTAGVPEFDAGSLLLAWKKDPSGTLDKLNFKTVRVAGVVAEVRNGGDIVDLRAIADGRIVCVLKGGGGSAYRVDQILTVEGTCTPLNERNQVTLLNCTVVGVLETRQSLGQVNDTSGGPPDHAGMVYVRPYTRKDGTRVSGYWRRK